MCVCYRYGRTHEQTRTSAANLIKVLMRAPTTEERAEAARALATEYDLAELHASLQPQPESAVASATAGGVAEVAEA